MEVDYSKYDKQFTLLQYLALCKSEIPSHQTRNCKKNSRIFQKLLPTRHLMLVVLQETNQDNVATYCTFCFLSCL